MKNYIAAFFLLLAISFSHAQKTPTAIKVTYLKTSNGKLVENQDPVVIFANLITTVITTQHILDKKSEFPYEQSYIDRKTGYYYQLAQLNAEKTTMTIDSSSIGKQTFEILDDTKMILGYKCRKAKTVINSNNIELWYTDELGLKGAPTVLGQNLGLVLEVTRNGNYTFSVEKIEEMKSIPSIAPQKKIKKVDILTYRDLLWKSRFTIIPVFKNEVINFSDKSKSNDSVFKYANGTIVLRKIKIPEIKKGSQIFVDVSEQSNGDAYDRTGSVFIIPTDNKLSFLNGLQNSAKELPVYDNGNGKQYQGVVRTDNYSPLLELMRFFTPFGVKQYNTIQLKNKTWQDSVYYRQDISEMHPVLSGKEIWIGANIGNYDKGGHKISLNLTIHPEEDGKAGSDFILPLFNTNNVMEMAGQEYATMFNNDKGLEVGFTLAANVKNARLRYITTGHGGWENGDEFVQKKNTVLLDGKNVYSFIPWRMDCGSFRSYNPASGNFNNGLSSSDYSRSNWCPGTVTNPVYIDLGNLAAGKHTIQIKIPQGEPEGNSFSSWNVSGVLIGEK
ncbi:MAG TPA: PNGase F N-terminal domain-containing protein [Flavobacterium sp.]|nr:PNGase F N-terminal domain-containing protein [Flavobacterium sp.]